MPKAPAGAKRAPAPSKSSADTRRIMATLATQHPNADTELHFTNAYELLVATILSAQCTDERVNQVTPALFKRYPDASSLARATTDELEPQIQSTGFFRAKSRALIGMASASVERHRGEVPKTMTELVELPGVGRKTANVVLGHALGVPGLPVDRHVLRVSNRIGIARSDDPEVVEQQLCAALPPAQWTVTSDTLILHGRRICRPRPLCDQCAVRDDCDYYRTLLGATPSARAKRATRKLVAGPLRATGGAGALRQSRAGSGTSVKKPRAANKLRPSRGGSGSSVATLRAANKLRSSRAGSGSSVEMSRAASERRPSRGGSGSSVEKPRAAEPRGTGRGGGAPRQSKK
jgi:endonuclease III